MTGTRPAWLTDRSLVKSLGPVVGLVWVAAAALGYTVGITSSGDINEIVLLILEGTIFAILVIWLLVAMRVWPQRRFALLALTHRRRPVGDRVGDRQLRRLPGRRDLPGTGGVALPGVIHRHGRVHRPRCGQPLRQSPVGVARRCHRLWCCRSGRQRRPAHAVHPVLPRGWAVTDGGAHLSGDRPDARRARDRPGGPRVAVVVEGDAEPGRRIRRLRGGRLKPGPQPRVESLRLHRDT